jgi:hypothetical protein
VFWTVPPGRVAFLLVAGLRPDRPGFTVVPLDPIPLDDVPGWTGARIREEGPDFGSAMPGAELEGLYELRTAGEVLKLGARTLAFLESDRARKGSEARAAEPARATREAGPGASTLAYTRITLAP